MNIDNLFTILGSITSLLLGALTTLLVALTTYLFGRVDQQARLRELSKTGEFPNFREKMKRLSEDLARASAEVDKTLEEMAMVSRAREEALRSLEAKLDELSRHEKELQTRVETLKNVPLPAVEFFLEMTEKGEKRSAARDYILFGAGVIVSTVITVILRLVFNI